MSDSQQARGNRAVLLLIAGIPLTIILAATWLWYYVVHGDLDLVSMLGTQNQGELVKPPRDLKEHSFTDERGQPFQYKLEKPQWTLLVPVAAVGCDVNCESRLYTTRQIHIAMGKEFKRLRREVVTRSAIAEMPMGVAELSDGGAAPATFAAYLEAEHRGLAAYRADDALYGELFAEQLAAPDTWYLVDPAGWVMMAYNSGHHYKDVMSDLKFLLKNSSD